MDVEGAWRDLRKYIVPKYRKEAFGKFMHYIEESGWDGQGYMWEWPKKWAEVHKWYEINYGEEDDIND